MSKKTLVSAITAALVVGAASTTFAANNPFSDVPADSWAYDAVSTLAADGVIDGYPDGTYQGQNTMTRYEMAQIVARAMAKEDLQKAIDACFEYDDAILVEEFIKGRELSIPVYGNKEKKALPIIEITTNSGRYDYKSKYTKGESFHIIPAPLSEELTAKIQRIF